MKGEIYMIEVNCSEDTREPEKWVAMYQPCYSKEEGLRKLKRMRGAKDMHKFPIRLAKYIAREVIEQ